MKSEELDDLFCRYDCQSLLTDKRLVIMGDSIQRSVYKDFVLLLQEDRLLDESELRRKGEYSHQNDQLLYGGKKEKMSNSTNFREHRKYFHEETRTKVEFVFITRIFNEYLADIFGQLEDNPPDILIINSALWDLHRYGLFADDRYKENIRKAGFHLANIMTLEDTGTPRLLVWSVSLPVSSESRAGFVDKEFQGTVGGGVNAANQTAKAVMRQHGAEVIDFYKLFEDQLHHRVRDGVHWDAIAHRRITNYILLLAVNHLYGKDHPKSTKAKQILAGSPLSDTPIAVPRRRPWLRSASPSSPSAFLFTPAETKENNKLKRSRSPSPNQTDFKRCRKVFESSHNYSRSPAYRVVSYLRRGFQRVKSLFKRPSTSRYGAQRTVWRTHPRNRRYYDQWHYW